MSPIETVLDALRNSGGRPVSAGKAQWQARCPAHDDNVRSLSVGISGDKILLSCHAGCHVNDILVVVIGIVVYLALGYAFHPMVIGAPVFGR